MVAEWDVVIVGFGPGGAVASSLLGQAGHRVLVIDKAPGPYGQPRMSTLDGEIARVLQHASDPREAMLDAIPARGIALFGADDAPVPPIDWDYRIAGHWSHYSLHQPNIEAAMTRRIAACRHVALRWGCRAVKIEDGETDALITIEVSPQGGGESRTETHRARYILGFDGAKSFVRESLGISLEVIHEHSDQWILTDFDALRPLPPELQQTQFHMRPERAWFAGPNGANRCRTDVRVLPHEDLTSELSEDKGYAFLEQHFGVTRADVRLTRRVAYRFRSHIARSFGKGHVFIGGDAAHAMTPYMGQGACCAMRDAINIAWKLRLVLDDAVDASILESYEVERLPQSRFFVNGSLYAWKTVNESDPAAAAARDAAGRSGGPVRIPIPGLVGGIVRRGPSGDLTPGAGQLAPQGRVEMEGREGLLDDLVGFGGQLVSAVPIRDLLGPERLRRLAELGVHVLHVAGADADGADVIERDDSYRDAWTAFDAVALLARPDHYLYGCARDPQDVVTMVDEFFEALPAASHAYEEQPIYRRAQA
ncbi:FAD-dependent monooxygenase [Ancylobacter sp. IITR112]|uniref:FAD-dependent monooxygenase n=1 Tax=Ancylobacter sp. IITR112 TaxID=3138073 RepID=UPI00352B1877